VLFILADDHATNALGCYGSCINETPRIDQLASEGALFENCFCTNSLCAPSRASILTGTYNHVNGVQTLSTHFDAAQPTFASVLQAAGYSTALFGKWHLGHGPDHNPRGFDFWRILPGQGEYIDPVMIEMGHEDRWVDVKGYVTEALTDMAIDWIEHRDPSKPFCLVLGHKAPHHPWTTDPAHRDAFDRIVAEPGTLHDDYGTRAEAAAAARMRIGRDLPWLDLRDPMPADLTDQQRTSWIYQRFISAYLGCVSALDRNVGRLMDHLDHAGLADDTVIIYSSDQGFFLGEHGWYDKRFMYEESLRMPLLIRYPREVPAGTRLQHMVANVDLAQTILDLAEVPAPARMQGRSIRPLWRGEDCADWPTSVYYRYWEHDDSDHHVRAHYGVRTSRYKLIYYYSDGLGLDGASPISHRPEWELFDLAADPNELRNVYADSAYGSVRAELTAELERIQREVGDMPHWPPPSSP
jgi:arylsulfatase A-like enzyme